VNRSIACDCNQLNDNGSVIVALTVFGIFPGARTPLLGAERLEGSADHRGVAANTRWPVRWLKRALQVVELATRHVLAPHQGAENAISFGYVFRFAWIVVDLMFRAVRQDYAANELGVESEFFG